MNATIESLFGPPSEPIDIPAFIQAATAIPIEEDNTGEPLSVADECDVSDIRDDLSKTWNSPRLSAYLSNNHDQLLTALNSTTKAARTKRKAQLQDSLDLPSDIVALQDHLGAKSASEPSAHLSKDNNAIVTLTVFIRSTWSSGYINRSSQHALLSSQTLGDLYRVIPCISNEIVANDAHNGDFQEHREDEGCVICIGNTVYGDGHCEDDYAQYVVYLKIYRCN
ncbi:hypothetical protein C0993_006893 [Termitomyces sp. T159_Od127]|nr:hypothetical protein C0993_006893 [Termitomyces sp. T159_Od127]